ncbi:MAG: DUF1189 family protein [Legionellaceae bacterium]|nr:DUF1189 family protein [Legionellaceae bacterium]
MKRLSRDKKNAKKQKEVAHYRFFEAIYKSFFSGKLYIDVVRRWRGFGALYLFLLLSVLTLPYAVRVMVNYQDTMAQSLLLPMEKLPPFSVYEGRVQFHSPMPYLVKNNQDEVIAVIDTTGSVKQLPYFLYPKASVLVTESALHVLVPNIDLFNQGNLPPAKETVSSFGANHTVHFSGEAWLESNHMKSIHYILTLSFYPVLLMVYFGSYVALLFSFALFGQFIARFIFKVHLTFKAAARLVAVAATPQAVIYFALFTWKHVYPGTGVWYVALLATYFSLGVLAYRRDNMAMVLK